MQSSAWPHVAEMPAARRREIVRKIRSRPHARGRLLPESARSSPHSNSERVPLRHPSGTTAANSYPSAFHSRYFLCRSFQRSRLTQECFCAGHALPRRLLHISRTVPVRLQTHRAAVTVAKHRAELRLIVDNPAAHAFPVVSSIRVSLHIFQMHVPDALFGQQRVTFGKGFVAQACGIAGIPVKEEILIFYGGKCPRSFGTGCCVALVFVFENQHNVLCGSFIGKFAQFSVHVLAVRPVVLKPPKIEHSHFVRGKTLRHRSCPL